MLPEEPRKGRWHPGRIFSSESASLSFEAYGLKGQNLILSGESLYQVCVGASWAIRCKWPRFARPQFGLRFIHPWVCVCVCVSPQVDVKTVEDTAFGLSVLNSRVGPSLMAVSVMVSPSVQGYFSGTSQIVIITGFVYCDVLKEIDFYR